MTERIIVGYDGSEGANRALDFAAGRAKAQGAHITIAHILEWSPYTFLTPEELEERHGRRKEELKRAEASILAPVLEKLSADGVEADAVLKYGHIAETLCAIANDAGANQLVIGRTGHSALALRLFGSVAGSLAQVSPVPVTIVP